MRQGLLSRARKAIRPPSGDQTGARLTKFVSWRAPPWLNERRNTCERRSAPMAATASEDPSGDHAGDPLTWIPGAIGRTSLPSASITHSSNSFRLTALHRSPQSLSPRTKAMFEPSGDHDGESTGHRPEPSIKSSSSEPSAEITWIDLCTYAPIE